MHNTEHENLIRSARSLLDRFMFEAEQLRADLANLRMKTDERLPPPAEASASDLTPEEMMNVAA